MHFLIINTLRKNFYYISILCAITIFAYIFSLNNTFVWDDEQFIYNNEYVKNFQIKNILTENTIAGAGETSTYYRPLTTLSFAIDYQIWGFNPFGFHLTNTIIHILTGLLLFFYLRTLKFPKLASLAISSIFLVHPLQTEAVTYVNSRGDSMYAFWTMILILSFALLLTKKYPKIKIYDLELALTKKHLFSLTIFAYLFAIFGKEIGIASLGLTGLTFLFIFFTNPKSSKNFSIKTTLTKNITGVFVIFLNILTALFYLLLRNKVLLIQATQNIYFAGTTYGESIFVRLHTFTQVIWTYLGLIFFPYPLHMERTVKILEKPISFWLVVTLTLILFITILAIKEYKKQKTVYIAFGSLWFLGMLIPVSGIIPVNGLIYEHWLYVPIIGICITLYGIKKLFTPKHLHKKINEIVKGILFFIIVIYIALTIRQNYLWANPIRFYNYTLQFSESARLRNNLAISYANVEDYKNAIQQYNRAIEVGDFYAQTHHNLANTYLAVGETELAKKEFAIAVRINEKFYPSYLSLINLFIKEKEYKNVLPLIDKLIESSPNNTNYKHLKEQILLKIENSAKLYK